jgi:glucuronokinase
MTAPGPRGRGAACARAALAGNPSDGYGGAVLAFTFSQRRALATATMAPRLSSEPRSELVEATVRRFARDLHPAAVETAVEWTTDIPRGVGLGGSSAIVIATLNALCDLYQVTPGPRRLAALALAVEAEDLGIAAGLQDRVAQTHGGLTFMDFDSSRCAGDGQGQYERLSPPSLPPLLIAWCDDAADDSGTVHAPLQVRFARGEAAVVDGMAALAQLAREARDAVLAGDTPALARCADLSFDARRQMLALHPRHVQMVDCARACGVGANYTGSGGAVVGVCRDEHQREQAITALQQIGAATIIPTIEQPRSNDERLYDPQA